MASDTGKVGGVVRGGVVWCSNHSYMVGVTVMLLPVCILHGFAHWLLPIIKC